MIAEEINESKNIYVRFDNKMIVLPTFQRFPIGFLRNLDEINHKIEFNTFRIVIQKQLDEEVKKIKLMTRLLRPIDSEGVLTFLLSENVLKKEWDNKYDDVWNKY